MKERNILITGGAGFIGHHLVKHFVKKYRKYHIIVLDKLTYCGKLENLKDVEHCDNYKFYKGDICDAALVDEIIRKENINGIIHLAAESHVDRSIEGPMVFAQTNVLGTLTLLECARRYWESTPDKYVGKRFHHVSTDEVFGSLVHGFFNEEMKYDPNSPYSASKASSDHFVRAYAKTYGMPITISNCSNNYGEGQYPEKLIPLSIKRLMEKKPISIYGTGENVRDWIYVGDHVRAIDLIFHEGNAGETYCVGGGTYGLKTNNEMVAQIMKAYSKAIGASKKEEEEISMLVEHVVDRKGHDLRYAIDNHKICSSLGYAPKTTFDDGITKTVKWYVDNKDWLYNW